MVHEQFPKIPHLPWSSYVQEDDIIQMGLYHIKSCESVIVTEKMNGGCVSFTSDGVYDKNMHKIDGGDTDHLKKMYTDRLYKIPENMRIIGENLFLRRSIYYDSLPDYFLVFAMFLDDICLSWDAVVAQSILWELKTVPILYRGPYDEDKIHDCWTGVSKCGGVQEGYVIRNTNGFFIDVFNKSVLKYVDNSIERLVPSMTKNKLYFV